MLGKGVRMKRKNNQRIMLKEKIMQKIQFCLYFLSKRIYYKLKRVLTPKKKKKKPGRFESLAPKRMSFAKQDNLVSLFYYKILEESGLWCPKKGWEED